MQSLLDKRLCLVTGKGGVGKSTVSLALAERAARAGKRTLLLVLAGQDLPRAVYGLRSEIGYEPTRLDRNLEIMALESRQALHEYVLRHLKFEFLVRKVFDNPVMRVFLDAMPGLKDLLLLGKLLDLYEGSASKDYDMLVADLPATGHALQMLRIPTTVMSMVLSGPIHRNAERMKGMLCNREKTGVVLVTLAEEMPVNESAELAAGLEKDVGIEVARVVVNGLLQHPLSTDELRALTNLAPKNQRWQLLLERGQSHAKRAAQQEAERQRLGSLLPATPQISVPYQFTKSFGVSDLRTVGDTLA